MWKLNLGSILSQRPFAQEKNVLLLAGNDVCYYKTKIIHPISTFTAALDIAELPVFLKMKCFLVHVVEVVARPSHGIPIDQLNNYLQYSVSFYRQVHSVRERIFMEIYYDDTHSRTYTYKDFSGMFITRSRGIHIVERQYFLQKTSRGRRCMFKSKISCKSRADSLYQEWSELDAIIKNIYCSFALYFYLF